MKKWIINTPSAEQAKTLSREAGISEFTAKLLLNRSITDRNQADVFFNGGEISDPKEIADVEKAAKLIDLTIAKGEKITVYGDYDCDGVTAAVILFGYLESMGANADWYIPSRKEGYGLNTYAIDKLAKKGTKLIVTVDNGISAVKEADYIYKKGMKLIITDHHQVPERLPRAEAIINPHRADDRSSCKDLAGCGVALKLLMALEGNIDEVMQNCGDLAAVGTVGDIVPLRGENRTIVKKGLENITLTSNGGLKALLMKCGFNDDSDVTATDAAFTVCPRINAAGRFAHPGEAMDLFLCDNPRMYNTLAERLSMLNTQRQEEEKRIMEEIDAIIAKKPRIVKERVIVVSGVNWNHGVIGIVASKLMSRYSKPVIVLLREGAEARGSARSVEGFSMYKMLCAISRVRPGILLKHGGHDRAAGLTVNNFRMKEFKRLVQLYAKKFFPQMPTEPLRAEMTLSAEELTMDNVAGLEFFQPFGEGNPTPVFHIKDAVIKNLRPLKEGKYLSFDAEIEGREFKTVNFRSSYGDFPYKEGERVDLMVNAEINEYNGRSSINLKLADIRRSGFEQDRFFAAQSAYERLCTGEDIEPRLAKRILPDREALTKVYSVVKDCSSVSGCGVLAEKQGINYCLFRVCLDVLQSGGLMRVNLASDRVEVVKTEGKVEIMECELMRKLRRRFGAG